MKKSTKLEPHELVEFVRCLYDVEYTCCFSGRILRWMDAVLPPQVHDEVEIPAEFFAEKKVAAE